MLRLLLFTRLRYYRNFLRAHFDRVTLIELGGIFLILFFLTLRSPADIGYRLDFLLAEDFARKWAEQWLVLLPFFYLTAEAFAFITLRPSNEAQMLGALPVARRALLPYHVARHLFKTFGLILLGAAFFLLGKEDLSARLFAALTALAFMLALHLLAFVQAFALRTSTMPPLRGARGVLFFDTSTEPKVLKARKSFHDAITPPCPPQGGNSARVRWLAVESIILAALLLAQAWLNPFSQSIFAASGKLLFALAMLTGAWLLARKVYDPARLIEAPPLFSFRLKARNKRTEKALSPTDKNGQREAAASSLSVGRFYPLGKIFPQNFIAAQMKRDLLFLTREKRSLLFLSAGAFALLSLASFAQTQAVHAYSSALFIHLLYCMTMINALMALFEHDAPALGLLRSLPIRAAQFWRARWLLVSGLLALPMFVPTCIIAAKFGVNWKLALFLLTTWLILPSIFGLLLCNAALGMFPHAKYASILMNVFALLMLLFWFYMPFGTIILLGFTLTRVRKSQRHFQYIALE